jgi:hypothetical protein
MSFVNAPPATAGVPEALLFEDFKQQCANLQGQYARMHNRLQLLTGLNTALLPTLGAVALATGKGDVGQRWLLLFPLAGLLLSAVGFAAGAADRELVIFYRDQLAWTAGCLLSAYAEGAFEYERWLHTGRDPDYVRRHLAERRTEPRGQRRRSLWDQMTSWRWGPLSVTRLPAVQSLAFAVIWLVLLAVLLARS